MVERRVAGGQVAQCGDERREEVRCCGGLSAADGPVEGRFGVFRLDGPEKPQDAGRKR